MDLSNMSLADLRKLSQDVQAAVDQRKNSDIAAARQQIEEIAKSVGIPLPELLSGRDGKGTKKAGKSTGTVAVRYRHPDEATQQWTGRGRQPHWVKEWVESGKPLADLLVE
jgi:DNA-binding protein H-NS